MNAEFWRGKKVFVTGHTGFKGSWLVLWLNRLGAEICGYALAPPTTPGLFQLAALGQLASSNVCDIRDASLLRSELLRFQPDVVLHLAAQSIVLRSYEDPLETFATNVMGTANLLSAARELSKHCVIVNVTTDKVYENQRWAWGYRETDRLGGRDPYSSSKACAELVAHAFDASYFASRNDAQAPIGLASARAGNVIGGGDWTPRQLIPETVEALSHGQAVVLRHPNAIRPWQHVLDCLSGYLVLAESLYGDRRRYAGAWNFGPFDADMLGVSRVVELLATHWGVVKPWTQDPGNHPHEEADLRLNSQLAQRELGWQTRLALPEAIAWTARWYRDFAAGVSARTLCDAQIAQYAKLVQRPERSET